MTTKTALVTAGATEEPIDSVRYVSNFSSGRTGVLFARELQRRGMNVTLLAGRRVNVPEGLEAERFGSTRDLYRKLKERCTKDAPDFLFMSAAVSDYTPVGSSRKDGKIDSSEQDTLELKLRRTPKILSHLREWCGIQTFIIGFKLLDGASENELREAAYKQVRSNRTNLCVANDLSEIGGGDHPVRLIGPENDQQAIPIEATKREAMVSDVVDIVMKRQDVTWSKSVCEGTYLQKYLDVSPEKSLLLGTAQGMNLYPDTSGNLSILLEGGDQFLVTPRQVQKAQVGMDQMLKIDLTDPEDREVRYRVFVGANEESKPSIDSSVQSILYQKTKAEALVHFHHHPIVLPQAGTSFPYPCGVQEEARETLSTLEENDLLGEEAWMVELQYHGYVLGLQSNKAIDRFNQSWAEVLE
jgi:phosphopantothenoylcysteine decarboxylase/phosphopantothenate--cysteine ligase